MRERLLTKVRRWKIKRKGSWRSEGERERGEREERQAWEGEEMGERKMEKNENPSRVGRREENKRTKCEVIGAR